MTKLGYYPGCSLLGSAKEYDESLKAISDKLGIELTEIPDWNCCGATAAHNLNRDLSLALPARVLSLAEQANLEEILVPCAACYNRLATVRHELLSDEKLRTRISEIIGMEYKGTARVINILELLAKITSNGISGLLLNPFEYTIACYYGCLLVRPPKIMKFDRAEDPQIMDTVMKKIGANPIDWAFKVECCGAGLSIARTEIVAKLSGKIVNDAVNRGAEAIIVACPMCHSNLDMRRDKIERLNGKKYSIPVIYITQAVGLAMGINYKKLGLHRHLVPVKLPAKLQTLKEKETIRNGKTEEL
jgi:heterodisulfide reductase subunit B